MLSGLGALILGEQLPHSVRGASGAMSKRTIVVALCSSVPSVSSGDMRVKMGSSGLWATGLCYQAFAGPPKGGNSIPLLLRWRM